MRFRLWDPKSRKIVCSHNVFFDKIKMYKKFAKTVEIRKVIFHQEDGNLPKEAHVELPKEVNVGGQAPPPQGQE